jgi:hypothetical protein
MASTYNIWLGNPRHASYRWQELCAEVVKLFLPVIKKHRDFDRVCVRSTKEKPSLLPHELLVYVVPGLSHGVIATRFGSRKKSEDQYGYTEWEGAETGAEVYIRQLEPQHVAKFVFHEALHAKTHLDGPALHKEGGLAAGHLDYYDAVLTKSDVALMSKHLSNAYTPWSGGFDAVTPQGKIDTNTDDPLAGL